MKKMLLLAAIAALAGSCAKTDSCNITPSGNDIQISATIADISPSSRVAYTNGSTAEWADNDALGLFCTQSSPAAANLQFTVTGTASTPVWTPATTIYWKDGTTQHSVLAYAPYAAGNSSSAAVKVPALATQTGTINAAQDLLYSKNLGTTGVTRGTAVALTFTHALALIEFKMLIGGGIATGTTLTNFILAAGANDKFYTSDTNSTIDIASGTLTLTGGTTTNTATITPTTPPVLTTTATPYYALILPGTYTAPTLTINIKDAGTTDFTTTTSSLTTTAFEAGKKYSYTVTISRTAITISNPTITDWITVPGAPITPGV